MGLNTLDIFSTQLGVLSSDTCGFDDALDDLSDTQKKVISRVTNR